MGIGYQGLVQDTRVWVQDTRVWYRILGFGYWILGFGTRCEYISLDRRVCICICQLVDMDSKDSLDIYLQYLANVYSVHSGVQR